MASTSGEIVFFDTIIPESGVYATSFRLSAQAEIGPYTVTAGRGTETATQTFQVKSAQNSGPAPSGSSGNVSGSTTPSTDSAIGTTIPASAVTKTSRETDDGRKIEQLNVEAAQLARSLAALPSQPDSKPKLIIPVTAEPTNTSEVVLPLNALKEGAADSQGAELEFQRQDVTFTLPLNALSKLNVPGSAGNLVVSIGKADPDTADALGQTLASQGIQSAGELIEFQIRVENENTVLDVEDFGNVYLTRTFLVPAAADGQEWTVVWYDPVTKSFTFVPGQLNQTEAGAAISVKTNHNSVYTIVKTKKVEFTDVPSSHWAKASIDNLAGRMLLAGRADNKFAPSATVTRAEFSVMLVKALGLMPIQGQTPFADVPGKEWYAPYVYTAWKSGLISGINEQRFGPSEPITRVQLAALIDRALTWVDEPPPTRTPESYRAAYVDWNKIPAWAARSVARNIETGLMKGVSADRFDGDKKVTRAEAASVLHRMLVHIGFLA